MHANISITEGIYGQLTHEGVIEGIQNLGKDNQNAIPQDKENNNLKALIRLLIKQNPDLIDGIFE